MSQLLIGNAEVVWAWSVRDFIHIDLRDFDLAIDFGDIPTNPPGGTPANPPAKTPTNPPAKTADGLPCRVTAVFWLRPKQDAEALRKATSGFPANPNPAEICGSEYFKNLLRADLRATVQKSVGSFELAQLLTDGKTGNQIEQLIRDDVTKDATKQGFTLIDCVALVNVLGPAESAFSVDSLKQWDQFQRRRDEAELDDRRRKNEKILAEERLKTEHQAHVEDMKAQAGRDQLRRAEELEKATDEKNRATERLATEFKRFQVGEETARDQMQSELDRINNAAQERSIQYEHNRKKLEDAGNAESDDLKAKAAHSRQMANEDHERKLAESRRAEETVDATHKVEVARLKAQLAEIEKSAALTNATLTETLGIAEAKVIRETELAKGSLEVALQETLLKYLPDVLSKSVAPVERMAEVRYLHLGGSEKSESTFNPSIVGAISHLPLVADVLEFIKSWKHVGSRGENAPERSAQALSNRSALMTSADGATPGRSGPPAEHPQPRDVPTTPGASSSG